MCQQNQSSNLENETEDISDIYDNFSKLCKQYKIDTIAISAELFKKNPERFFLNLQNIINEKDVDKIEDICCELQKNWEGNDITPIKIKYKSSSKKQTFEVIIYPICLFYNRRIVYLYGYGLNPNSQEKLSYYNYRLDNIQQISHSPEYKYLIPLGWELENCQVVSKLLENKEKLQKLNSETVYYEFQKAFGVDTEKTVQTMLLRFPQDFHKGYIKGSRRHDTFKQLIFNPDTDDSDIFLEQLKEVLKQENKKNESQTKITPDDEKLIRKIVEKYPQDAYYTMNYRHGEEGEYNVEADVIMRLRAWCPNVEVLLPADLRQRMKEDMQKTWELYQDD